MLARGPPNPSIRVIAALLGCSLLPFALSAAEPRPAVWSDRAYGADGPWNAVEVSLRGQPKVALFPGSMWYTWVTTGDYCALNASFAHCQSGTYDQSDAFREFDTPGAQLLWRPPLQDLAPSIKALGRVQLVADLVHLRDDMFLIENQTLALIERNYHMLEYPDSTQYPVFTGCLNVGAPQRHQTLTTGGDGPNVNKTTIPWGLRDDGRTSSSSFGLHYGSAGPTAKMSGSLLYGGYDRNRVVGKVLPLEGDLSTPVSLLDISIRVIAGHSPFESLTDNPDPDKQPVATGLLAQGNSSLSTAGLPVLLDPCNPYLSLPKSTCDAIAAHLPVTYNPAIGLYLWNTSSPRYTRIVASASTLSFTITGQTSETTEPLTIHIPFRHLNLTLTAPFSNLGGSDGNAPPIPYFPCSAYGADAAGTGVYSLGRAFFQDAFLGANWENNAVWLAQAPGPNVPGAVDAVDILPDEAVIASGGEDWEGSWEGVWSVLSEEEADGTASVDVADEGETGGGGGGTSLGDGAGEGEGGLSVGAMAGIGVGAALGGMAVVGLAVLLWCRRQRKTPALLPPSPEGLETSPAPPPANGYGHMGAPAEVDGAGWRVHEMHGEVWKVHEVHGETWKVHEMPVPVPEMQGDRPPH